MTTARRSSAMPEVPTIAEAGKAFGLAAFDVDAWFGRFGPAHLPAETTARLNKAFVEAIESSEIRARLASLFAEPMTGSPERFAAFDIDTWFGLFGPAHLSAETTARLNKAFVEAIESSEIRARLASLFAEPMAGSPERFAAFVKSELAKYERVVKASGARVE